MTEEQAIEYYKNCSKTHPLGRVGQTSDISELVLFLADSSKSGFMTGTTISVDGGRLLTSASAFKN
jgi:NAD(P)-dependent dehydrogenase (short-subunit alcohol dehydrogenase family)